MFLSCFTLCPETLNTFYGSIDSVNMLDGLLCSRYQKFSCEKVPSLMKLNMSCRTTWQNK